MELGHYGWNRNVNYFQTNAEFVIKAAPATSSYGVFNIGDGPFDGLTVGKFNGSTSGTIYAANAASGFLGTLLDLQTAGTSRFKVDYQGITQLNNTGRYIYTPQLQLNIYASFAGDGISLSGDSSYATSPSYSLTDGNTVRSQFGIAYQAGHFTGLSQFYDTCIVAKAGNLIIDEANSEAGTITLATGGVAKAVLKGNDTSSSGIATLLNYTPRTNQSGTAGYTAFLINITETTTGSGTKLLLDAQVGSVSKFSVSNTGLITSRGVSIPDDLLALSWMEVAV